MTKKGEGKGKEKTIGDRHSHSMYNQRHDKNTTLIKKRNKNKLKIKSESHVSDLKVEKKEKSEVQKSSDMEDNLLQNDMNEDDKSVDSGADKKVKSTKKKNPYTLFVGNLPYTATSEQVKKHFEKAGNVKEVRIPTDKKTNKQRGFAYIQLNDRSTYEKALTLHHTRILGRTINVEYTTQGKKGGPKEEKIKQKNLKLRALSKVGILPTISRASKVKKEKKKKRKAEDSKIIEGSEIN